MRSHKVVGFSTCWSWTLPDSLYLRPIWALDITNSSQFDEQSFWPVVWWFPTGWVLVHSHHCHLKTTQALKHIRQAWETSPKKSRSVNHCQWYTHGLLVPWCSNWGVVKSMPCHLVRTRSISVNLVTFKIPILTATNSYHFYTTTVKIGILYVIECITSIFILFQ